MKTWDWCNGLSECSSQQGSIFTGSQSDEHQITLDSPQVKKNG